MADAASLHSDAWVLILRRVKRRNRLLWYGTISKKLLWAMRRVFVERGYYINLRWIPYRELASFVWCPFVKTNSERWSSDFQGWPVHGLKTAALRGPTTAPSELRELWFEDTSAIAGINFRSENSPLNTLILNGGTRAQTGLQTILRDLQGYTRFGATLRKLRIYKYLACADDVSGMSALRTLDLNTAVGPFTWFPPALVKLSIKWVVGQTTAALVDWEALGRLTGLRQLCLRGLVMPPAASNLSSLRLLQKLEIDEVVGVVTLPQLRSLKVRRSRNEGSTGVAAPRLTRLKVRFWQSINLHDYPCLRELCICVKQQEMQVTYPSTIYIPTTLRKLVVQNIGAVILTQSPEHRLEKFKARTTLLEGGLESKFIKLRNTYTGPAFLMNAAAYDGSTYDGSTYLQGWGGEEPRYLKINMVASDWCAPRTCVFLELEGGRLPTNLCELTTLRHLHIPSEERPPGAPPQPLCFGCPLKVADFL